MLVLLVSQIMHVLLKRIFDSTDVKSLKGILFCIIGEQITLGTASV